MTVREIVQQGNPVLDAVAQEVAKDEFGSKDLEALVQDLSDTLATTDVGVAIAAPQIGVSKRVFVVRGRVFGEDEPDQVFINPVITKQSKKAEFMEEGCLSCLYWYGDVKRQLKTTISYRMLDGTAATRGAGDLLAHIFQHEIDHLNGVLFVSKAKNLRQESDERKDEQES